MTDWINFPAYTPAVVMPPTLENATGVKRWLLIVAALVFLMVVVGGATRLTESGLSITEWAPVTGVIPPLTRAEWLAAFEDYKKIPQYKELFPDMDLARFQAIYAWEWGHRLLGRLIGLVFALPLAWFWIKGRLPRGLKPKLVGILALGALQGVAGWWMVASGLDKRVEVAQERLAVHLLLAAVIFSACVWVAAGLGPSARVMVVRGRRRLSFFALLLLVLVFAQLGLGAITAGLRAGYAYNTWPLMDGVFIPPFEQLFNLSPWWANLVDNVTTVQFDHRMMAYVLLGLSFVHLADAGFSPGARGARRGAVLVFGHLAMQVALGIATLLLVVPLWAGLAHQAVAMGVLAVATLHARRLYTAESE